MDLRVGEFFSGIGAMHLALDAALPDTQKSTSRVKIAFDINQVANATYQLNHKLKVTTKLIEHLPVDFYDRLDLNVWLMSPPCQPFTRGGNQRDHEDERSAGLLYLIRVLATMANPPRYIFLENVLNFEKSECRRLLVDELVVLGYVFEEYLVSPMDLNIPNDRLRYYLIARRSEKKDGKGALPISSGGAIITSFSQIYDSAQMEQLRTEKLKIQDYLQPANDHDQTLLIPTRYLTDYKNYRHDIVHPHDTRSTTFTKAYGSDYIIGTGSFLQTALLEELREYEKDDPEVLLRLGLRWFAPEEVMALQGFPAGFEFAEGTTRIQKYRLLGNSMNVRVVSVLLKRLLTEL